MIDWLHNIDEQLFLAINGAWPAGDTIMWGVSNPFMWTPLYIVMIYYVLKLHKGRTTRLIILIGTLVCIGAADILSARILKPTTARLRPSHRVELVDEIKLYEKSDGEIYRGGKYGFVSSHAANHMGLAVFIGAIICSGFYGWWILGLIAWAILIGYSRVHLGVHYPGDVICGWLFGATIGALVYHFISPNLNLARLNQGATT